MGISIHALVKRATNQLSGLICARFNFNPRPREEGDILRAGKKGDAAISIHALVKRATYQIVLHCGAVSAFQSTPS